MFTKLKVWDLSMEIVELVYKKTQFFPDFEKFNLVSQINRSAVSIPSNIAEGKGRGSDKEFRQFLYVARGSLCELRTQLELSRRLGYMKSDRELRDKVVELESMINALITKLS